MEITENNEPESIFPITDWTLIGRLKDGDAETARQAREEIWKLYEEPVRATLAKFRPPHLEVDDLFQAFCCRALRNDFFENADPEKGQLRCLLVTSLRNFLYSETRRETRECRDRRKTFSLDEIGEDREPEHPWSEDEFFHYFDRKFAGQTVNHAIDSARGKYRGKIPFDQMLQLYLKRSGSDSVEFQAALSEHGMKSEALFQARSRFGKLITESLIEKVRDLVPGEGDWKTEYNYLWNTLKH